MVRTKKPSMESGIQYSLKSRLRSVRGKEVTITSNTASMQDSVKFLPRPLRMRLSVEGLRRRRSRRGRLKDKRKKRDSDWKRRRSKEEELRLFLKFLFYFQALVRNIRLSWEDLGILKRHRKNVSGAFLGMNSKLESSGLNL